MRSTFARALISAALIALALSADPALGARTVLKGADDTILFSADTLSHDRQLDIVTARGSVEITYKARTLLADTVSYDRKHDLMTASGNVTVLEESGEVTFADYAELTADMRDGIAENIRVILADGARIAANGGRRTSDDTEFAKAVYSPCNLCEDDPTAPPIWQLKAIRVLHDKMDQRISYEDAWLELGGLPVFYTPYFSHPDPSVPRQSGFLSPSFGTSSTLGAVLRVPYYWAIDHHSDATVTPFVTDKDGSGAQLEYRQRLRNGRIDTASSLAFDKKNDFHGHVDLTSRFDLNDDWRWGADIIRTTDDAYLARHGIDYRLTLKSRVYAERFKGDNYASFESYVFQGLGTGDNHPDRVPQPLPIVTLDERTTPDRYGNRFGVNGNLAMLRRKDGTDMQRLSVRPYWHLPYRAPAGDVYDATAELKSDFYNVNDQIRGASQRSYSGATGRLQPEISFGWRYPFVKREKRAFQTIEPHVRFFAATNGGNSSKIPNQDSAEFEFDDTNLLIANRFPGIDRTEGGMRVHYGGRWGLYGDGGGNADVFIGQSYRFTKDDTFAAQSGLEDKFSDLVGRFSLHTGPLLDMHYRTRINKRNLNPRRHELRLHAGPQRLRTTLDYVFYDHIANSEFAGREQLSATVSSRFDANWRAQISTVRDIAARKTRSADLNVVYEDECLIFSTHFNRRFYTRQNLAQDSSIFFRITLKTLGEINLNGGSL